MARSRQTILNESQSVAEFIGDRTTQLEIANWAYYMLGMDRCVAFSICFMSQEQDTELHRKAWDIFHAWSDWQADIKEGSR